VKHEEDYGNFFTSPLPSNYDDILITRRLTNDFLRNQGLKRVWTVKYIWALGMGTVLTGFYVQRNLGWHFSGFFSMLVAMIIIAFIYFSLIIAAAELTVHFPYAGGAYAYARRGLGMFGGFFAGSTSTLQFIFAAATLLALLKDYLIFISPTVPAVLLSIVIFSWLMAGYVFDTRISVIVQFFATNCALSGIVLFCIGSSHAVGTFNYLSGPVPSLNLAEIFAVLPFVIWFFLGLEGLTVLAEESKHPQQNLPRGFIVTAVSTIVLTFGVWHFAAGTLPWGLLSQSKYPLLFILQHVQSQDRVLLSTFSAVSLCAFLSGLNGLINGYSRQVFSLARAGYLPHVFSRLYFGRRTPYLAVIVPGLVVVPAAFFLSLDFMTYMTVVCALMTHLLVFISFFRIRQLEPSLFRLWGTAYQPYLFGIAAVLVLLVLASVLYYYRLEMGKAILIGALLGIYYYFWARDRVRDEAPEESMAVSGEKRIKVDFH